MNNEKETPIFHKFFFLGGSIIAIITIGSISYAIFLVHQYLVIVGYFWLVSFALMPTIAVTAACTWLGRYIFKIENIELGPSGNLIRHFGKTTEYHPLGIREHRVRVKEEKEKFQVPALLEILKSGLLGTGDLLLGYHLDGTARWGMWDDLRTFVVAGKSRSGKTVTMVFFILQALLSGAVVYVCDPHHNKPTGLLKALEPIIPFLRIARTDQEILEVTSQFREEMLARRNGSVTELRPMVLVYDEWSELLRELESSDVELLVNTVLGCAEAYAGFGGYAIVGGHEWTARESGGKKGGAIRRGFHSAFVHRLDDEYAKFLLKGAAGKKAAMKAPNLPRGQAYFQDSEGELDYLLIPFYGKEKEAVYEVAEMLKQIAAPVTQEKLSPVSSPEYQTSSQKYIDSEAVNSVKRLHGPVNEGETTTIEGETFTIEDTLYTPEKETKILLAAFQLAQKGNKVTRTDIMNRLGWTRKQWPIIKSVCDKHNIAI